jgi:hypothetical protein
MDDDRGYPDGRVPLRELGDPGPGARRDSIRRVRRMSNWTAAALMVGTGAAAVALAHQTFTASAPVAGTAGQAGGAASAGTTGASSQAAGGPQVTHSVATTTASGVTVTTTTRTVNGKTVVTQVRHVPAHTDD